MRTCPLGHECEKCLLWARIPGVNTITQIAQDVEDCALNMINILLIDNIRRTDQVAATIESFRNEMVNQQGNFLGIMRDAVNEQKLLEN